MRLYEFKAKEILARYGISTPRGRVCRSADEAALACREIGGAVAFEGSMIDLPVVIRARRLLERAESWAR